MAAKKALQASISNIHDEVIEAVTDTNKWKNELLKADEIDIQRAYFSLKHPMNSFHKPLSATDATALAMLQSTTNASTDEETSLSNKKAIDAFKAKNADHKRWKDLLVKKGGSLLVCEEFLCKRARDKNPLVAALAKERLFIMTQVKQEHLDKKTQSTMELPRAIPFVIMNMFKVLAKRIKASTAIEPQDAAIFDFFYRDLYIQANLQNIYKMQNYSAEKSSYDQSNNSSNKSNFQTNNNNIASSSQNNNTQHIDKSNKGGNKGAGKGTKNRDGPYTNTSNNSKQYGAFTKKEFKQPNATEAANVKNTLEAAVGKSSDELKKAAEEASSAHRDAAAYFWSKFCRNCYLGNLGFNEHRPYQCKQLGNPCFLECFDCKKQGYEGMIHWSADCTYKNKN